MQEWAAARELFTCRLEVTNGSDLDAKSEEYVRSYDMSGQFVALKPNQYKNNEALHLTITDSNGTILLDDKKSFAKTSLLPGSAKAASNLGVFALQDPRTKEDSQTLVPSSNFEKSIFFQKCKHTKGYNWEIGAHDVDC